DSRSRENESCRADRDDAESAACPAERTETGARALSALTCDLRSHPFDATSLSRPSEHQLPPFCVIGRRTANGASRAASPTAIGPRLVDEGRCFVSLPPK